MDLIFDLIIELISLLTFRRDSRLRRMELENQANKETQEK